MDALASLARDSELFGDAVRSARLTRASPRAPGVDGRRPALPPCRGAGLLGARRRPGPGEGTDGDEVEPLARPSSDAELPALLQRSTSRLVAALTGRDPDEPCWSWHEEGRHVGWVLRRQAHEALVHRADAELTAGRDVTPADPAVAADGVDEVLSVMVDGVPGWGVFTPDGATVSVVVDGPGAPAELGARVRALHGDRSGVGDGVRPRRRAARRPARLDDDAGLRPGLGARPVALGPWPGGRARRGGRSRPRRAAAPDRGGGHAVAFATSTRAAEVGPREADAGTGGPISAQRSATSSSG